MDINSRVNENLSRRRRWLRFLIGLVLIILFTVFFASGYSPPGFMGKVIRHNQAHDIDASPLFYTEVEGMPAIIVDVAELRAAAVGNIDTSIEKEN